MNRILIIFSGFLFFFSLIYLLLLATHTPIGRNFNDLLILETKYKFAGDQSSSANLMLKIGQEQLRAREILRVQPFWNRGPWEAYQSALNDYLGEFLHFQAAQEQARALQTQVTITLNSLNKNVLSWEISGPENRLFHLTSTKLADVQKTLLPLFVSILRVPSETEQTENASAMSFQLQTLKDRIAEHRSTAFSEENKLKYYKIETQADSLAEEVNKLIFALQNLKQKEVKLEESTQRTNELQDPALESWVFNLVAVLILNIASALGLMYLFYQLGRVGKTLQNAP